MERTRCISRCLPGWLAMSARSSGTGGLPTAASLQGITAATRTFCSPTGIGRARRQPGGPRSGAAAPAQRARTGISAAGNSSGIAPTSQCFPRMALPARLRLRQRPRRCPRRRPQRARRGLQRPPRRPPRCPLRRPLRRRTQRRLQSPSRSRSQSRSPPPPRPPRPRVQVACAQARRATTPASADPSGACAATGPRGATTDRPGRRAAAGRHIPLLVARAQAPRARSPAIADPSGEAVAPVRRGATTSRPGRLTAAGHRCSLPRRSGCIGSWERRQPELGAAASPFVCASTFRCATVLTLPWVR